MFYNIGKLIYNILYPSTTKTLGRWSILNCNKMIDRRIYMANIDNSYDLYVKKE